MTKNETVGSETPADVLHICALTYHEITEDPRVWKEALALRKRGHRVTVFCNSTSNLPRQEESNGIEIIRFAAYDYDHVSRSAFEQVEYLGPAREQVMARLAPYLDHAERGLRNRDAFEANRQVDGIKQTYKSYSGLKRIVKKLEYFRARKQFKRNWKHLGSDVIDTLNSHSQTMREFERNLYQTNGYVFAMNLMRVIGDHRPDAVHAHDIYCLPGGIAFAQAVQAKLIYDAHEYEPARATRMAEDGSNIADELEMDCLRHVDRMITVSGNIQKLYMNRFSGPAPTLIYNAPPIPDVPEMTDDIRTRSSLGQDVPLLIFTGGVQRENRGLDKVLEALALLPDVHLALMGPRNARNDGWLMKIAKNLGVADRIHLVPGVEARMVTQVIGTADAAIIPTQDVSLNNRYCMPNKLFESAFSGIPIVASNLPDIRAFIDEMGIGVTVDQTDPKSLAEGIRTVLNDPAQFRLTDAGWAHLRESYSWEAQERKLVAVVEGLCAERVTVDA